MFKKNKKPKEEVQKSEARNEQQTFDEGVFRELPPVAPELVSAFSESEPWSRERYEGYRDHGGFGYGVGVSYEEYLLLFKKYKDRIREQEYRSQYYKNSYGG